MIAGEKIDKKLAEFVFSLKYEDISAEVEDTVKHLFLDYAGLSYRGAFVESSQAVMDFLEGIDALSEEKPQEKDLGRREKGVVAGTKYRATPEYCCLANGCFSHSLELDDVVSEASLHPGVVVFPAALSAAEVSGASGRDFVTAVVAGYEVMIRVGKAINPAEHYKHGFHPTGTCGTFGAAAVVAKLFGMNEEEIISAFGISASKAASSMEFLNDGAWTKRFHPGWAAHSGYLAASLAGKGFVGPSTGIGGKYGFLNSYSHGASFDLAVEELGSSFLTLNTSIKPHACCRYNQSPIDAAIELVGKSSISSADIKSIDVKLVSSGIQLVGEPIEAKRSPSNEVDAQFSLPFAIASAILYGRLSLEEYRQEIFNSSEVKELMEKVSCSSDPELDKEFPKKWPCKIEITTVDGGYYEHRLDYPKGDPENPLSQEEIVSKFETLTSDMEPGNREDFVKKVNSLEKVEHIGEITKCLLRKN